MAEQVPAVNAPGTPARPGQMRLWQLISPALPVGGYSYSQGLEAAVNAGWVDDATSLEFWLRGIGENVLVTHELPHFLRIHAAYEKADHATAARWSEALAASRETSELRREDKHMADALRRLLRTLDATFSPPAGCGAHCYPAVFAAIAAHWGIAADNAAAGLVWAWLENQVNAASRLMPLGQSAAQLILFTLAAYIDDWVVQAAMFDDDDVGFTAPGLMIASARHETQYSRLFRS